MLSKILFRVFLIFILSIAIISCSKDEPLSPAEDHFEAEGMVFYESGIKIVEIFRGVTQDTFFVPLGEKTPHIKIKFLSPERNEINPPNYKEKPLSWSISDTSIVSVVQHTGQEGSYEFHLFGKKVGTTDIEFFILHEGHSDFRSGKIPVRVR
ncbi:MAG: Ig-like domain-containing protein [Ignavibacteria bacterium]